MPIQIPADLPARSALESENIFVMTDERAVRQDIRPLDIVIVNLMPTKIATETQLLRLLGNSPLQVNITLLRTAEHQSKNTPLQHLERFYKTFSEIRHRSFDGMIVTGAPVEHLPFEQVDYWQELLDIMTYANGHVFSTLYICWAAQAALYHFYGVPKYELPEKRSGIFRHQVLHPDCRLFRGFDDDFPAPHSRHTEVRAEDVRRTPNLRILAESDEAGLTLVESLDHSQVFMTGHLEYDRGTLDAEYRRDLARGMNPHVPSHYYPNDDPSQLPRMNWRAHAHLFYNNWLNYYVYQETPYDFVMQGSKLLSEAAMKFSTRTRYGSGFLCAWRPSPTTPCSSWGQVAQEESISPGYLEQIVRALKPLGILRAVRGSGGAMPCPNHRQKSIWRMSSCIWKARYPRFLPRTRQSLPARGALLHQGLLASAGRTRP